MDSEEVGFGALIVGIIYLVGFGIAMWIISSLIVWIEFPNKIGWLVIDGEWKLVWLLSLQEGLYVVGKAVVPALLWGIPISAGIGIAFYAFMNR